MSLRIVSTRSSGLLCFRVLGVETESVNDPDKAGAAQDLLRNAVQLMLNVAVDVGRQHISPVPKAARPE